MMPATMHEQPARQQRVTVAEAASTLGLSVEHVRRMIRQGALKGERVQRGRGWSWCVILDAAPTMGPPVAEVDVREQVDTLATMLATFSRAVAPLMAPLMTPLVAQLVDQAETIGRLRAEATFRRTAPRRQAPGRAARRSRPAGTGGA